MPEYKNYKSICFLLQPVEEPVVGKEKKRRKLDEIVLGLSAAKEQSLFPETLKKPTIAPSVTVTPTSAPVSSAHSQSQKPFTITVTSVPSPAPPRSSSIPNMLPSLSASGKDSFSSLLAQAEQLKKQQQQRKSYEAMIADINKETGFGKVNSYSHEAKVNKWLAEQSAVLAEQPLGADYLAPRRRRPRVDPSLLDWKKLTGDENVSVINRVTGKKLTGPKAPTLKRLGQWLVENPMYDIDPKWADLVKERGNLSHDLQKRLPSTSKKGGGMPGRPPLLSSPTGSAAGTSSSNINTSLASNLSSFPSLASSGLGGLNTNLLSGLSGLGQFDSKNPLLMPFAGLPNVNALSSMGGLGNLSNMNLFANLAGLGIPGLGGMDPATLAAEAAKSGNNTSSSSKSKSQKPAEAHSSSKTQSSSSASAAASSIPTSSPFPFFFPNPSLLYTPLGLGGLTPFSLQPGMSAYDTLAQQCGLLNGNLNPAASPNSTSKSGKSTRPPSSSTATSTSQSSPSPGPKIPKTSSREAQLQQLLLPPDTHLLESISKVAGSLDASMKYKKDDKRKALESLRGMLPTDFTKDKKMLSPGLADFGKLLESTATKKSQEQQMKEALEQLSKNNADFMARAFAETSSSGKRSRESTDSSTVEEESAAKRQKESQESAQPSPNTEQTPGVDIEALLPPSTVVKSTTPPPSDADEKENPPQPPPPPPQQHETDQEKPPTETETAQQAAASPQPQESGATTTAASGEGGTAGGENPESPPKKSTKRTRSKRKSGELPLDHEAIIEKKNLRSSASRSAAAAAARAAAAEQAKLEAAEAQKAAQENDESA